MKVNNPFDRALEARTKMPESIRAAAVDVTDTLELAWDAARAVFEKHAKPEHAFMLLPLFLDRAAVERQRLLDDARSRMKAGTKPPAAKRPAGKAG